MSCLSVNNNDKGLIFIESFEISLVGGVAPNAGRVEVRYDEEWLNVCYESDEYDTRKWSFTNAQVVCDELGFPGTMLAGQGGQGNGTRQSVVSGYKCREGEYQVLQVFNM